METRSFNLSSFPADPLPDTSDPELLDQVPPAYYNHPEFGELPFSVGLDSVIELIHKRTQYSRTLVKKGTNGTEVYLQNSYFPMHFLDNNGWWRTIDERLHPSQQVSGLYEANSQPSPTRIDAASQHAYVQNGSTTLKFNENLTLYHEDVSGNRTLIGVANWTDYTAGSEGVRVTDIWPGIDMEMIVSGGKVKTNYYVKAPMAFAGGWLVIQDHPEIPAGFSAAFASTVVDQDGLNHSGINVTGANNTLAYTLSPAYGYDQSNNRGQTVSFGCKLGMNNEWQIYIPVSWAGNSALQFPLVIDPLVSSGATMAQAAIAGSGLNNAGGFTNSCNYTMNVPTPANCTITNMLWSFTYLAQNGAVLCDGGLDFLVGACRSPSAAGFYWFCNNCFFAGTCAGTNISIWADISSCIGAPACASYNIPVTMRFYDRWAGPTCDNFFVAANSNWVMTIQGQTVAQPAAPASSNGTTICLGTFTTLTASGQFGVPGYTYLWSPGGATTQSVTVSPAATTTYTCTITDACGQTAVNTVTITVNTLNTLTPAPTFSISLSPASGNPCPVTATVTYTGASNYGGGAETYQWSFGGASAVAGGATSGSANAPPYGGPYTVTYNSAGSYALSVTIYKGGQCATATQTITICGALPVELLTFEGYYNGNGQVILDWSTASENGNSFFTVERTTDGVNFEDIGRVYSQAPGGNSMYPLSYTFTDEHPLTGTAYYRLKQTDINGNEERFNLISVTVSKENFGFFVHPNPVQENAFVSFYAGSESPATIEVLDHTGRIVYYDEVTAVEGANTFTVDLAGYAEGLYFVRVDNGGQRFSAKLVKDR